MPDRSIARPAACALTVSVDVVLFTPTGSELAVLVTPPASGSGRPELPSGALHASEGLDDAALRIAKEVTGVRPAFLEQARAIGGAQHGSQAADIAVTYFGLVPGDSGAQPVGEWVPLSNVDRLTDRPREEIDLALSAMRSRMDLQPIAFRLLPQAFTLSDLQQVYELLLGRRLHKASFRRALHASALVEPTEEWRSEGRGRPAQLFRYAPPRRRRQRRGIRFDLLN